MGRQRHPLLYVPALKTQLHLSWEMHHVDRISNKHHSVYMEVKRDEEVEKVDKFAEFRTDALNIQLSIELPGSDCIGADNWVALRVDVLPWFTHIHSTLTHSSQTQETDSKPLPMFRNVAVNASVTNMKMAIWFEEPGDEDVNGMCLIVRAINYSASVDGDKVIVIEGPVKAALLNVREFKNVVNAVGAYQENNAIMVLEQIASEFGAVENRSNSNAFDNMIRPVSFRAEEIGYDLKLAFLKLQELSSNIRELDYIAVIDQIDICNKLMTKVLPCPSSKRSRASLEKSKNQQFITWSILVARCRLLWTLEIRDSLMGISKDLIYTVGFMDSQRRQSQVLSKETSEQDSSTGQSSGMSSSFAGKGNSLSLRDSSFNQSGLEFLLTESLHAEQIHEDASRFIDIKCTKELNATLPILELHLSNPQVQLHSIATGGSIILAMERAQVEARKFIHFIVPNARSKAETFSPSDLLRKTGMFCVCDRIGGLIIHDMLNVTPEFIRLSRQSMLTP